jgi:hypothetical protein
VFTSVESIFAITGMKSKGGFLKPAKMEGQMNGWAY